MKNPFGPRNHGTSCECQICTSSPFSEKPSRGEPGWRPKKSSQEPCPLNDSNGNRYSPKNAIEAMCYQLHDDIRMLWAFSHLESPESADNQLKIIEERIKYTRSLIPPYKKIKRK